MDITPPFALLDDCSAGTGRWYAGFVREHRCEDPATLEATWAAVQADLQAGRHALLLADYEWGARLLGVRGAAAGGALSVLVFERLDRLDAAAVAARLAAIDGNVPGIAGLADLQPSVDRARFMADVERVREFIRDGETYQVNLTYRLRGRAFGSPVALYRRLRERQPVPYGALVARPGGEWVLSLSPELFVRHDGDRLQARPMKGTVARGADAAADEAAAQWLAHDVKNRAENLMIVDLLRNDLGRVAAVGSVTVPRLFEIERYRTVHQMTSTIEARLRPGAGVPEVLRALFPCGSVTGAPKHHTMELIARLETTPRRLYTGSIGWVDAGGDFCWSVAIRTLLLGPEGADGARPAELGVGGGIVLDSDPAAEHDETLTKARFATALDPGFRLFETMRVAGTRRVAQQEAHLARLQASARRHRFAYDAATLGSQVLAAAAGASGEGPWRLRLALAHDGSHELTVAPLSRIARPVRFLLADAPLPPHERALAGDKTTARATYDAAIRAAEAAGAFDVVFVHADGRLSEGARSSVFLRLDGRWCTPPLTGPVLPGTRRARLLRRLHAEERALTPADLARAERVLLCNALRGALPAMHAGSYRLER